MRSSTSHATTCTFLKYRSAFVGDQPGSTNIDRFNDWYDDKIANDMEGVDTSEIEYDNSGTIVTALEDVLPDHEALGVGIEYGVVDLRCTIDSLIADN